MTYDPTPAEWNVLGAVMGCSNYGYGLPEQRVIRDMLSNRFITLESAVETVAAPWMESDSHYDMFLEEAVHWKAQGMEMGYESIMKTWPDIGIAVFGQA